MRRFELQEGASHKLWEVYVAGDTLAVRFGKAGTQGQTQTKQFKSDSAFSSWTARAASSPSSPPT